MADASDLPAAELRGVTKRFGEVRALEGIDLAARPGEFLTLLGPSGCGKTTALRLFSGLDRPDAGSVLLAGRDVTALPPYRREVNQVFQSYALFPHLTVAGNIAFGLKMKRLPAAEIARRVAEVVRLTALDDLTARPPDELSGGQRQRVALARALVCQPRVLLLDEPLSALDARLRAQVRGELRALQRRLGLTFIFVTHDQEEALTLSDRVAVLRSGKVEQIGRPEEIYHRPANRFVAEFVGEANLIEATPVRLEGGLLSCALNDGSNQLLRVRPPDEAASWPGDRSVTLMVRPEKVRLFTQPPASEANVVQVRVADRIFQGSATMLELKFAGPAGLTAEPTLCWRALAAGESPAVGAEVGAVFYACIAPEDCRILP